VVEGAVALDSEILKKSPVDGARFRSLSITVTSKRHAGVVVPVHDSGNSDGAADVSRYCPRKVSTFWPGGSGGGFWPMQIIDSSTGSITSAVPWMPNGEPIRLVPCSS
jgi:hypothetical protein